MINDLNKLICQDNFLIIGEIIKKEKINIIKKDKAISIFGKWYISLIVGEIIIKINGARNEPKKRKYNKFIPSIL